MEGRAFGETAGLNGAKKHGLPALGYGLNFPSASPLVRPLDIGSLSFCHARCQGRYMAVPRDPIPSDHSGHFTLLAEGYEPRLDTFIYRGYAEVIVRKLLRVTSYVV